MASNLNLQPNEGIVVQFEDVTHERKNVELILTHLNLICVEPARRKNPPIVTKYPLNQVKIINDEAQVSVVKNDGDWILQVLFRNGEKKFVFEEGKIAADKMAEQISILLTGHPLTSADDNTILGGMKSMLGAIGIRLGSKEPEKVTTKCIGCMAPLSGEKGETARCRYCDTEQVL